MALIKCPECGSMVSDRATECPKCGCPLNRSEQPVETIERPIVENGEQKPKGKTWLIVLLIVVILAVVGGGI